MRATTNSISKRYRHEDLAADLRQQIRTGALKPGQKMPSLSKLNMELGIPQPTIIRAHDLLEREGLIVRRQGSGTYVANASEDIGIDSLQDGRNGVASKSLLILTSHMGPSDSGQHAPGWAMQTSLGMIQQSHYSNLHAVLLKTDHVTSSDLDQLIESHPYGIIVSEQIKEHISLLHDFWSKLVQSRLPIVELSGVNPDIDSVVSDQTAGAAMLTDWLIQNGRRRILCLLPPSDDLPWVSERLAGYEASMTRHGLVSRFAMLPDGGSSVPGSEAEFDVDARRHLGFIADHLVGPDHVDAIMVPTDGSVSAVSRACRIMGRVPNQDVWIAGYDNYWQEANERLWEPGKPVATIDKHNQKIGRELVSLLVDRVEGRLPLERQVKKVVPTLVVVDRHSTS